MIVSPPTVNAGFFTGSQCSRSAFTGPTRQLTSDLAGIELYLRKTDRILSYWKCRTVCLGLYPGVELEHPVGLGPGKLAVPPAAEIHVDVVVPVAAVGRPELDVQHLALAFAMVPDAPAPPLHSKAIQRGNPAPRISSARREFSTNPDRARSRYKRPR